jgi:shikimate kinase
VADCANKAWANRHLVLVGLMGTGKSTLGHALAARLERRLFDSDDMIEAREGRTVRQIWQSDGEALFRKLETAALLEALAGPPAVIAAAGGVVLSETNRDALLASGAMVVWLRADPELLAVRTTAGSHRPLLDEDRIATLRSMESARAALYAQVATEVVDVDGRSVEDLVDAVLA